MIGKVVLKEKISTNHLKIEKGNLESGMYFVTVYANGIRYTQKMIVN